MRGWRSSRSWPNLRLPRLTPAQIDRLEAIDGAVNRAIEAGKLPDYLAANHAFHFALYEAADAPVLLDLARSLVAAGGAIACGP